MDQFATHSGILEDFQESGANEVESCFYLLEPIYSAHWISVIYCGFLSDLWKQWEHLKGDSIRHIAQFRVMDPHQ